MVHHFDVPGRYGRLMLTAESLVELERFPELVFLTRDSWAELDAQVAQGDYWEMIMPSVFARPSQELNQLKNELGVARGEDPLTTIRDIKARIFQHFDYETKSTKVDSPIEVALRNGKGVCQDFAHIMIALCRELRIPCRYVSGYLFHDQRMDRSADGATHAWVEAFLPRNGWLGIDPTNDLFACERHVRTAIGRDYADVPPTKGLFKGDAKGELAVSVRVTLSDAPPEHAEADAQEQWIVTAEPEATSSDQQQQQQQQ